MVVGAIYLGVGGGGGREWRRERVKDREEEEGGLLLKLFLMPRRFSCHAHLFIKL